MEDPKESRQHRLQAIEDQNREELSKHKLAIEEFKSFASSKGLLLDDADFTYSHPVGVTANYPNIIERLGIPVARDKEGLVNFDVVRSNHETHPMAPGLLIGPNYILLANPFFRRRFHPSNNYAPRFIEYFWRINNPSIDSSIALDFDRLRINLDRTSYAESDTWYGAKFNRDIGLIKNDVVKLVPSPDIDEFHIEFIFGSVFCLDILWESKGAIKVFKSEEFKTADVIVERNGLQFHPVRYVHAEYDIEAKSFRHFDGAIHYYTTEEYYQRRVSDMNYNFKNRHHIKTTSEKLFKLNGKISVSEWLNLVSHFMTGNPLVFEYFEGDLPESLKEILANLRKGRTQS